MLKKLKSIRTKPKAVRNSYALVIAFICTFVIATFWVVSLPARFNTVANALSGVPQTGVLDSTRQPFSSLRSTANSVWTDIVGGNTNIPEESEVGEQSMDDTGQKTSVQEDSLDEKENIFPNTFTQLVASSSQKRSTTDFGTPILIATSSREVDTKTVD